MHDRPPPVLQRLVWRLEWLGVRGVSLLLQTFPPEAGDAFVRGLGRVYRRLDASRRGTVLENLRLVYGDTLSAGERERLSVAAFEHAFVILFEAVQRRRLVHDLRSFRRRSRVVGDGDLVREDVREGRGCFLLTAHIGNWEVAGAYLDYEGIPFAAVSRAVPNPYVQAHLMSTRRPTFEIFEKRGAVRGSLRAAQEGKWVTVLGDQNAGKHGVFVPFFGIPASTFPILASLAIRHDVTLYFGAAIRKGPRIAYDMHIVRYRPPATPGTDPVIDVLRGYHAWLEDMIRLYPEQYFWMHRRWKTRPPGELPGPRTPRYEHKARREPVEA